MQVRYDYELEGSKVVRMLYRDRLGAENILVPLYDSADSPIGIIYNNVPYWFVKNLQGDVLALKDKDGFETVRYVYDAWGNVTVQRDRSGVDLADINPFRYRGYLYDYEFGLYYLQSRYYDPELCRFVNADEAAYLGASGTNLGYNLFAYCENDPITNIDPDGHLVITTTMLICAGIGALVLGTVGGFAGYYISKKMNIPKGSRWKYVVGGAIIGAVVGAVAGFGLGYCIGGGSVVAVVGKSGTAISTKALKLGNKLHYVFGKATGSAHNIKRSQSMYSLLKKIGIWDNKFGNEYLTKCIIEIYKNATPYASKGKLVREAMLYGPGGGVMLKTIWEGTKLITVYIFG